MEEVSPSWLLDPNRYQPRVAIEALAPVADWECPTCGGAWMRNFVFKHAATCATYRQDSATQYADYSRLTRSKKRRFIRRMSMPEWIYTMSIAPGWLPSFTPENHPTTAVSRTKNGRYLVTAGFDPDKIAALLTVKE